MDFFGINKAIGKFFSSIFGGDDEEEKKRRRQQQAAQRAQPSKPTPQPKQQKPSSFGESVTSVLKTPSAQPNRQMVEEAAKKRQLLDQIIKTGKPTGNVMLNQPKLSPEEVSGALKERAKQQVYKKEGGNAYERAVEAVPISFQKMAQGIIRIPETIVRSGAQVADKATTGVDQDYSQADKNTGLRRFLYGSEPIKTYQKQGQEANEFVKKTTGVDLPAPLVAVALAALDTTGIGVKQAVENVVKGGADIAIRAVVKRAEKDLGRDLTEKEVDDLALKTRDALEKEAAKEPAKPETVTAQSAEKAGEPDVPIPTTKPIDKIAEDAANLPKREDVGKSYADMYNTINSDKSLTPQQKVDFLAEAKSRHIEMLKRVDEGTQAQQQIVDDAAKASAVTQNAQEQAVAQVQADRAARTTPPPEAVVQEAPVATEVSQNTAYNSDQAFREGQEARQKELSENPIKRLFDTVKRNVYDPRQVQQRLDKEEFKRLKKAGLVQKGQTELSPDASLAVAQGRIENPYRAADVRNKTKFDGGQGNAFNLEDIIKFYGKDDSPKARSFENYRIYKDELERQAMGSEPSLPVDPRVMADYVVKYEASNPLAIEHNAALRSSSLQALREKNEARIDAPELLENSEKFRFYNPREATDPEDIVRAKMSGGVRSGAKGTQLRADTAGGVVRSPLSLFVKRNVETERALATQQRDNIVRDKARQGVPGFNEVVDADKVIQHKQSLTTMRDLGDTIKSLQTVKKGAKRDAKQQAGVDKAKSDAVTLVRDYLREQATDEKSLKFADKIKDNEALDLFNVITEAGEVNAKRLTNKIAKDSGVPADQIRDFISGVQQEIKDIRVAKTAAFNDFIDTTQNLERGTQTINYKLDGEVGKVEIPIDLAKELSAANEAISNSPLEKTLQAISGIQKLTWTGALAPVFKTVNLLIKNPLLAYRNAEGLSGVNPNALFGGLRAFFKTPRMSAFTDEMLKRGAAYENALQTKNVNSTTADDIAARAGIIPFFSRNPVTSLGDLAKGLNQLLAYADNAQRTGVAYGAYRRARSLGFAEQDALNIASQAPARAFGDFDRVSRLAQNAEIILPYSGAIQAGTRALVRATTQRPVETAIKDATFIATAAGLTSYSMSNSSEYYQDMIDSGKEYELDDNFTIVLPGASKDENGNWTGVINIPLVPDLRPYNRAVWKSVYDLANGDGLEPTMIASELFNQFTGDIAGSLYDPSRSNEGENPVNAILSGSPILTMGKIASGTNPRTGEPLSDEYLSRLPRDQQATDYTSDAAKRLSEMLGGSLTPIQVDQVLSQLGSAGKVVQNRQEGDEEPNPIGNLFDIGKQFEPGKSMSNKQESSKQYFKDLEVVKSTITDEKTFKAFESAHSKGDPNAPKNILNSATKANQYMQYADGAFSTTPLFEAERKLDELQRAQGKPGNPLFDLAPQQLQKVLNYRSSKIANSAKQNYTKNGEGMFQALGLDNKWYSDFVKAESGYYKAVIPDGGKDSEILTFSGKKKPEASPELKLVEDTYYSLPEKSPERRAYLAAHPELKSFWAEENDFTDEERKALGFDEIPEYQSKGGYGSGYGGNWNALNPILNLGDEIERLDVNDRKMIEDLMPALRRLFAPHKGGRATVSLGAQASGNPRR